MESQIWVVSTLLISIVLIVLTIVKLKFHPFLALLLASFFVGAMMGMGPLEMVNAIESGIGGTLGFLAAVIGLGTILGKMMEVSGAAERIGLTLQRCRWYLHPTAYAGSTDRSHRKVIPTPHRSFHPVFFVARKVVRSLGCPSLQFRVHLITTLARRCKFCRPEKAASGRYSTRVVSEKPLKPTSSSSPLLSGPTPSGVPVSTTSPAFRVKKRDI